MMIRYEDPVWGDDSAANGLAFRCLGKDNAMGQQVVRVAHPGWYGNWKGFTSFFADFFVCAA